MRPLFRNWSQVIDRKTDKLGSQLAGYRVNTGWLAVAWGHTLGPAVPGYRKPAGGTWMVRLVEHPAYSAVHAAHRSSRASLAYLDKSRPVPYEWPGGGGNALRRCRVGDSCPSYRVSALQDFASSLLKLGKASTNHQTPESSLKYYLAISSYCVQYQVPAAAALLRYAVRVGLAGVRGPG